jgi:hypothetical protein
LGGVLDAQAIGSLVAGALVFGAAAIGALAIGRLVVGRFIVGKSQVRSLHVPVDRIASRSHDQIKPATCSLLPSTPQSFVELHQRQQLVTFRLS